MRNFLLFIIVVMFFMNMVLVIHKVKSVKSLPQPSVPPSLMPSVEDRPKRIDPEFVDVPVYHQKTEHSVLADVISHCKSTPYAGSSRSTNAHETAHFIHSELRKKYNTSAKPTNGFYAMEGRGVIIEEPKVRKSQVRYFLPENLRGYRYQLYFLSQSEWDETPLYILDEWSAYVIGGKCCVDDFNQGRHHEGWTDGVSGSLEFSIYVLGLCLTLEKEDPEYWKTNTQFKSFVNWQLKEANRTFLDGRKMDTFKWDKQDELLKQLLFSEEGKPFRAMLQNEFENTWLDAETKMAVEEQKYENFQKVILKTIDL